MTVRKNLVRYLLFFAIIQIITLSTLYLFKKQENDSLIIGQQAEIKHQYTLITNAYRQRMKMVSERLSTPAVLSLMEQAAVAGNEEERHQLRQQLYHNLLPMYEHEKNHFREIHFYFADGTSFLRMHQPQAFGDHRAASRPSVTLVNSTNQAMAGYEMGRHRQAYGFMFALATDHQLGSVEIGVPFSTLLNELTDNFPGVYQFITGRQMATAQLTPADLRDNFVSTSFSEDFLSERSKPNDNKQDRLLKKKEPISQEQLTQINQQLQPTLARLLPAYEPASLPFYLDGQAFLVHLLPIQDIAARNAGYLMVYEQSPCLIAMQGRYITGYILVSIFSIILIILHSQYTTSLLQRLQLQQQLQDELHESHGELNQIFNAAADGMWLVNFNKEIIRANTTMASLVNLPLDDVIGRKCHAIFAGNLCHTEDCPLHLISQGSQHIEFEADKRRTDGTALNCLVNAKPFYNGTGDLIGMIEDFCDITARKKMEQQLQSLSVTDELTGLCNRRGFMALARQQLSYVKRAGGTAFLVFADLDNMKWINDNLGHEIGDKALILTARLLQTTVRGTDIIGRMGGDEFSVLFTSASNNDSETILLARLDQELAEINKELPEQLQIAISFGVAHNSRDYSLEELLIAADAKMYIAKKRKKSEAAYKTREVFV